MLHTLILVLQIVILKKSLVKEVCYSMQKANLLPPRSLLSILPSPMAFIGPLLFERSDGSSKGLLNWSPSPPLSLGGRSVRWLFCLRGLRFSSPTGARSPPFAGFPENSWDESSFFDFGFSSFTSLLSATYKLMT